MAEVNPAVSRADERVREIYVRIKIVQVDCFGPGKNREFNWVCLRADLDDYLWRISHGFNMDHTLLYVNGVHVASDGYGWYDEADAARWEAIKDVS